MTDVPKYSDFFSPVLLVLSRFPTGLRRKEIKSEAAKEARLSSEQLRVPMPNGRGPLFGNRVGWAISYLGIAGLLESPSRGVWRLSPSGLKLLGEFPKGLPEAEVLRIDRSVRKEYRESRTRDGDSSDEASLSEPAGGRAPEEAIHASVLALETAVADELLKALLSLSPERFELVVLDVLRSMGYAWDAKGVNHTGQSGDGGIDGVIDMDPLGIQRIYVQAKKWSGNVGRKEIQAFVGSLAGFRARMGVFITSSGFTREALEYVQMMPDTVIPVDGPKLARLMIQHEVGVTPQIIKIPKLDSDYFEDA